MEEDTKTQEGAESARNEKLDEAWTAAPFLMPDGTALRAFSHGTLVNCRAFGLSLFYDPKTRTGAPQAEDEASGIRRLSDIEFEEQVFAFAWMQSAPLAEVLAAKRSGNWLERIEEFSFNVPVDLVERLVREVLRISGIITAASFKVKNKPGHEEETGRPKS